MKHIHFSKIFSCLFSVIFLVALCSCEQIENNSSDETPLPTLTSVATPSYVQSSEADIPSEPTTPSGAVISPEAAVPSETSPMSMYKSVLLNNAELYSIDYKENMNITQLIDPFDDNVTKIIKFTVLDLDYDGTPEVILWKSINEDMNDGFEVLHYHDEVVYGYNFTYRSFLNLKADGTYMVSGGAMDYGFGTISFTEDTWAIDRMASCESSYDAENNLSNSYFVNHERATEEEFLSAVNKQSEKASAVWYDFTDENIDEMLTHTGYASEQDKESLSTLSGINSTSVDADGIIYLDINNDGAEEKTEYVKEQNVLKVTNDNQLLIETNLYDYGVTFNYTGLHEVLYYYEYVSDSSGNIYLHLYTSYLIGNDGEGKRNVSASENYYEIESDQWNLVDSVKYVWVWDYSEAPSVQIGMNVNGQNVDSLENINRKYKAIENTYFEIPYPPLPLSTKTRIQAESIWETFILQTSDRRKPEP